jgi:tRNA pseudouridine55 synthase
MGEPLHPPRAVAFSPPELEAACRGLRGEIRQVPPAFSAKRLEGRRLYELARRGAAVERRAVPVSVHALEVRQTAGDRVSLLVRCSSGTYVRALARDLGEALGCGGHLVELRRTFAGGFDLARSVPGDALGPEARDLLIPLRECLGELPAVHVTEEGERALKHGRDLPRGLTASGFPGTRPPDRVRLLDAEGELLALAVPQGFGLDLPGLPLEPVLHPDVVLVG